MVSEFLGSLASYHFQHSQGGKGGNDNIEECLQSFVLLMEELLVGDAQESQQPDSPPQLYWHSTEVSQLEPGGVGPSYEQVYHGSVTSVQQVSPYPDMIGVQTSSLSRL